MPLARLYIDTLISEQVDLAQTGAFILIDGFKLFDENSTFNEFQIGQKHIKNLNFGVDTLKPKTSGFTNVEACRFQQKQ